MPRFRVRVTRDAGTESADVTVTADDRSDAEEKALELANSGDDSVKWAFNEGNCPDDAYIGDPDIGDHIGGDIEPLDCQKCGTPLNKKGYCKDKTCPYSDHLQGETFTEG